MGLHLSDRHLRQLQELIGFCATPLEQPRADDWLAGLNRRVAALFEADGVMAILPDDGERPLFHFHNADPELAATLRDIVLGTGDGVLRFRYPKLDLYMRRLAMAGVRVWTPELGERVSRIRIDQMPYHHEVVVPHRTRHQVNLAVPFPEGPALIALYHTNPRRDPFGEDRVPLLQLLLPAFRSAVETVRGFDRRRAAYERELEAHPNGIIVFDRDGRSVFRNRKAIRILSGPAADLVRSNAGALVTRLRTMRERPRKSAPEPPRSIHRGVERNGRPEFRLTACVLPEGMVTRSWAVLVRVARLSPILPEADVLQKTWGLTPRQAEVARLIAEDRTSPQIAEALGISVHTVERHAEAVLRVLKLRSRKGVGSRLMTS